MEKAQYLILGIGEDCEETPTIITRYVFNRIKESFYNSTKTSADIWTSTTDCGAYYEIKTYFDCTNEKKHTLYILIERKAKNGFAFV